MIELKIKTRLLIIIGLFTFSFIIPQGFASCLENEDWPDAPCNDSFPINRTEFQMEWAPYYDYKGSEFMESKYEEMLQAIKNGSFREWSNDSRENFNVYYYNLSTDKVPNQYDRFVFDDEYEKYTAFPPYFVITLTSIFVIIILVITITFASRRKRK